MEINDDDLKAEEIINNNLKTKKIKDIQLKIQPQAKKKVEKILGYESGNQVMKGIIYWLKRKLNKKNLIYIFDKEKKILEKFENFDDYIKLNTINNKKDFDYLHSKYKKIVDFLNKDYLSTFQLRFKKNENFLPFNESVYFDILEIYTVDYNLIDFLNNKIKKNNKYKNIFDNKLLEDLGKKNSIKSRNVLNDKYFNNFYTQENSNIKNNNEKSTQIINNKLIDTKITKKEITLSFFNSQDFPIKISHFIPLIHILSFTSKEFSELNTLLCSNIIPFNTFPLKISFPLGLSLNACLSVTEFKSDIIQDISISDFSKENKDNLSIDNFSTALDDKYAKDFYDKYFQEKNIGAFSEFSDDSFNKDIFSKGNKMNYSDLFRDDDFTDEKYENKKNILYVLKNEEKLENQDDYLHKNLDDSIEFKINYEENIEEETDKIDKSNIIEMDTPNKCQIVKNFFCKSKKFQNYSRQIKFSEDNEDIISNFENTLEENTTLQLYKYSNTLKYNKPPQFRQKMRNLNKKSDDLKSYLNFRNKNSYDPSLLLNLDKINNCKSFNAEKTYNNSSIQMGAEMSNFYLPTYSNADNNDLENNNSNYEKSQNDKDKGAAFKILTMNKNESEKISINKNLNTNNIKIYNNLDLDNSASINKFTDNFDIFSNNELFNVNIENNSQNVFESINLNIRNKIEKFNNELIFKKKLIFPYKKSKKNIDTECVKTIINNFNDEDNKNFEEEVLPEKTIFHNINKINEIQLKFIKLNYKNLKINVKKRNEIPKYVQQINDNFNFNKLNRFENLKQNNNFIKKFESKINNTLNDKNNLNESIEKNIAVESDKIL